VKIDPLIISALKKSIDLNLIENSLLKLDFNQCQLLEEIDSYYYKNGNIQKRTNKRGQFTNIENYSVDNNGFIISASKTKGYYSFNYKYLYKYF